MADVHDVAAYILSKTGEITAWKLQKLVYYSQAWASVWDDEVLFDSHIQAWANGPVCPQLYQQHRGKFKISKLRKGSSKRLKKHQKETIDTVIKHYGEFSAQYLSELTHSESPWEEARVGLAPGERGNREIPVSAMAEYYGGL